MRNHDAKYDRFECGEGNTCEIAWGPIIGGIGGGLLGLMGAKESGDAQRDAAEMNAEATRPQFYGPGTQYADQILGNASNIYGNQGFAPQVNPLQLLGRQNQLGYAENVLPGLIGDAQSSWQRGLSGGLDPTVAAMIEAGQNDLTQDYMRNVMPSISDRAQAVGGYGGSRQGVAQGIASEGLLEAQGDLSTGILNNAYNQSLGQQRAAWNVSPQMSALGFLPSLTQQDVGAMYQSDANQPAHNLAGFQGAVQPWYTAGQSGNPGFQAGPSSIGAALGGALTGARIGGSDWFGNIFAPKPDFTLPPANTGTYSPANPTGGYSHGGFHY